jgi:hypothetical protein
MMSHGEAHLPFSNHIVPLGSNEIPLEFNGSKDLELNKSP